MTSPRACPERSRRAGCKLSTHELARFLGLLAETGNFALACDRLGRAKSGLYKRRQRDPVFNARCKLAIRRFPSSPGAAHPPKRATEEPSSTILSRYANRPQLRRVKPGTLTRAGRKAFFETLSVTGNIRLAACSAGVQPSSIHYRRRTDPAFAAELREALALSRQMLTLRLIEAAHATFDPTFREPPLPEAGEGEQDQEPNPDLDPFAPLTTRMTVSQAINLVASLDRQQGADSERILNAFDQPPPSKGAEYRPFEEDDEEEVPDSAPPEPRVRRL